VPKRTIDYEAWLSEELQDAEVAGNYLSAAIEDSPQMFLEALKDVTQAHQVAKVAREAGVKRESLYKAFSEDGNPTFGTLHSVLNVFGLKMRFEPSSAATPSRARRGRIVKIERISQTTKKPRAAKLQARQAQTKRKRRDLERRPSSFRSTQ
jgi:probable addiction module antidote protein